MASESKSMYLLICLFAAAIVALGANELHQRFVRQRRGTGPNMQLIRQLHGHLGLDQGRLGPEEVRKLREEVGPENPESGFFEWLSRKFFKEDKGE